MVEKNARKTIKSESTGCNSQELDPLKAEPFLRAGKPLCGCYIALISFMQESIRWLKQFSSYLDCGYGFQLGSEAF